MQIFRPGANTIARILLVALAVLPVFAVGLTYRLWASPYYTQQNVTREQPVPFSHEHHVGGLGIACRYCHTSVEKARFAGMPPTHTCMSCHSQIWTNAPMLAPVRTSLANNEPIHWRRVHNLPDYVYFDHSVHVAKGVGCTSCHGAVQTMKLMRQVAPLTMSWCLDCHRNPEKNLRPRNEVFNMTWTPPPDQEERGASSSRPTTSSPQTALSECSICHR